MAIVLVFKIKEEIIYYIIGFNNSFIKMQLLCSRLVLVSNCLSYIFNDNVGLIQARMWFRNEINILKRFKLFMLKKYYWNTKVICVSKYKLHNGSNTNLIPIKKKLFYALPIQI